MFSLHFDPEGASPRLAIVTIDDPNKSVNTLAPAALDAVQGILDTIEGEPTVAAAILISGKANGFIAGADVETFAAAQDRRELEEFSRGGHALLSRIASSKKPVVAAIHGVCLGAGTEVALACHYRVATDSPKTVLGLPEVQLGLFPGGGGLGRLPRLIGLREALDLVLTGRRVRARKAKKLGLVDELVAPESLLVAARAAAQGLVTGDLETRDGPDDDITRVAIEGNALGRVVVFRQARKKVQEQTRGLYPAPLVAVDILERGASLPLADALALEPPAFAELAVSETSRSLVSLFLRSKALEKRGVLDDDGKPVEPDVVERLGIVGGGFMGADIAAVSADKGITARIRDIATEPLANALAHAEAYFRRKAKSVGERHYFKPRARLSGGLSLRGFGTMDLVIEAVPEDLALKQNVFAELDERCPSDTVLASNTSALPIAQIAEKCQHPERVVGLHFFSPVHKMPLLEIVAGPSTSHQTLATCVAFAKTIGKTPIIVRDGPGFYTTRILGFYMTAALQLVEAGHAIEDIDDGARAVGWPVGPMALMDEVGIDVGAKVLATLSSAFPERMEAMAANAETVDAFLADRRLGRKSGRGFYLYPDGKPKKPDPDVYRFFEHRPSQAPAATQESLGERLTFIFAMEAVRCLDEGIISDPADGDVGAVFGLGYPPMRGGPFRHLETLGLEAVVKRMDSLAERFGPAYEVPELLRSLAERGVGFESSNQTQGAA